MFYNCIYCNDIRKENINWFNEKCEQELKYYKCPFCIQCKYCGNIAGEVERYGPKKCHICDVYYYSYCTYFNVSNRKDCTRGEILLYDDKFEIRLDIGKDRKFISIVKEIKNKGEDVVGHPNNVNAFIDKHLKLLILE